MRQYTRSVQCRKPRLDIDLNIAPPSEREYHEGTSARAQSHHADAGKQGGTMLPEPIDLEAPDDVIIAEPVDLEAKANGGRNHGRTVVINLDYEDGLPHRKRQRTRANEIIINLDVYNELIGNRNSKLKEQTNNVQSTVSPSLQPKEATFRCPVCIGPLVEEMSTKCGHIFCKACIKAAIAAQGKCPTCRRKITMKNTIRIYLPSTCYQ